MLFWLVVVHTKKTTIDPTITLQMHLPGFECSVVRSLRLCKSCVGWVGVCVGVFCCRNIFIFWVCEAMPLLTELPRERMYGVCVCPVAVLHKFCSLKRVATY